MNRILLRATLAALIPASSAFPVDDPSGIQALRLIPFPKEELRRAGKEPPRVRSVQEAGAGGGGGDRSGPGGNWGGVGIEDSPPLCHFVTFGGVVEDDPAGTLERLNRTLGFSSAPTVRLYALEAR